MKNYNYPPPPENISEDVVKPSLKFSLQVKKVIALLIVFAILYLALVILTFGITVLLAILGIEMLERMINIWLVIFGIGVVGIGLMTFVFVIKFLFASKKDTNANRLEIEEQEYPELFDFIRKISIETATPFPKHIYLSSEVNASVFFDSNFWSMILPVRKNLVIGLGLVNMVNISEFKAIVAHEFGHFSQKSMRTGSYVYHAHKVLYNMLYENNEYIRALNSWASIHRIFAICASVTVKFVRGIQWILQQMFKVVNKQYMSLSREMEFHADAMSAKVAGSNNMIHALRRIEFASSCYDTVIQYYNRWLAEHYKGENVYSQQLITANFIAQSNSLPLTQKGLPLLHDMDTHFRSYSKINIEDQWSSHPSRAQREAALNKLGIKGKVEEDTAWILFNNIPYLQKYFTDQLYQTVKFDQESIALNDVDYKEKFEALAGANTYPSFYQGFYDNRYIRSFNIAPSDKPLENTDTSFFRNNKDIFKMLEAAKADKELISQIENPENNVKTFDYDGMRYKRREIPEVKLKIDNQINELDQSLKDKDEAVYRYFFQTLNSDNKERLTAMYQQYFKLNSLIKEMMEYLGTIPPMIQPFYQTNNLAEAKTLNAVLTEETIVIKEKLEDFTTNVKDIKGLENCPLPESVASFKYKTWNFINAQIKINGEKLDEIWTLLNAMQKWSNDSNFELQNSILEFQLKTS